MTKITTYIDDKLLKEAIRETGAQSQREALEAGLRSLMSEVRRNRFVKDFDKFPLGFTLAELRRSRGTPE